MTHNHPEIRYPPRNPVQNEEDPEDSYIAKYRRDATRKADEWSAYINLYIKHGVHIDQIPMHLSEETGDSVLVPNVFNDEDYVYHSYDMDTYNPTALKLPIHQYKNQILHELESHQVVIIQSSTGSGKTTQIPQYILDHNAKLKRKCNIVVTQPRRIAAQSVASRVCSERGWKVGELTGFQVGLKKLTSENTRLTYMTTGVLLRIINGTQTLNRYSHIIIDEVHERDILTDLLLAVIIKVMLETGDTTTKIMVMSATMDSAKFLNYFPKWSVPYLIVTPKILRIQLETNYEIEEYYIHDLVKIMCSGSHIKSFYQLLQPQLFERREPMLHSEVEKMFPMLIECLDGLEAAMYNHEENTGGVLVFLPGQMEIESLQERCIKYEKENKNPRCLKWEILPLFSNLSYDEQKKIFQPVEPGYRKIILATNIAESSITVPDIKYVVDFCLHKVNTCDKITKHACLVLEWVSKQEATQRKGRVGRVSNGLVFRMIPQSFYDNLSEESIPEMKRCALENVILEVKTLDLGPPTSVLALALDPPALHCIHDAVLTLKELGAFAPEDDACFRAFDGIITSLGTFISKLPVDVKVGKLISMGYIFGVLEETIIIAAAITVRDPYLSSSSNEVETYMTKLFWSGENFSDSFGILAVYKEWYTKVQNAKFSNTEDMNSWCRNNFVEVKSFREMTVFIEDIEQRISQNFAIKLDKSRFLVREMNEIDTWMLRLAIAAAFYPYYYVNNPPDRESYKRKLEREMYGKDPLKTLVYDGFPNGHPAKLYAGPIAKHIGLKGEGEQLARITSESGKAFVNFEGISVTIGDVPVDAYKGIKKRQLNKLVSFQTLVPTTSEGTFVNGESRTSLKGPKSILEMEFQPIDKTCYYRNVFVWRGSVNSIALDPRPGLQRRQLLVAGEVAVSERNSTSIIVKETTLFPPKIGISELCVLLFGPKVQLRREIQENRYTSCISGLGYVKKLQMSVFPDHDLELNFEIKIKRKDINQINDFRIGMCDILSRVKLQNHLKNEAKIMDDPKIPLFRLRLLDFLNQERVPVQQSVTFGRQFAWCLNQTEEEEESMDNLFKKEHQIFSLHSKRGVNRVSSESNVKLCQDRDGIQMFLDF